MSVCVRWRERGSIVCRPQIYDAVTLSEESSVSSAVTTRDKRSRFHAVFSFILTSYSAPLILHFYSNSLVLHHLLMCIHSTLFFPASFLPWNQSYTDKLDKTESCYLSVLALAMANRPCPFYPIQGCREAVPVCTGQWLFEAFNFTEQMDKPK